MMTRLTITRAVWLALLIGAAGLSAEVIDRIAVTVDKLVITESDIVRQMRVAAFLDGHILEATPERKRQAAGQLVEQALVRREMEISRYPAPDIAETDAMVAKLKAERFPNEDGYDRSLADHGLTERSLRESLLLQLTVLRFIEFRFRPGVTVSDEEVDAHYADKLLPEWTARGEQPPTLDDSRESIEEILVQQRVNEALDRWMTQSSRQAQIRYREGVF